MKTKLILLTLFIVLSSLAYSQTCSRYYPFKEGAEFELSSYDKKGKSVSKVKYKIKNVESNGAGETASIENEIYDKKGELVMNSSYNVECKDDVVYIDFSNLVSPQVLSTYKDMDVKMSGENLQIPNSLSVGQELPDANLQMDVSINPMNLKIKMYIKNRKVEAKEKVTTKAGTFDCYLISYDTEFKMGMLQKGHSRQWIAEKVGVVKQEDYNAKGNKIGHTELTAIKY